MKPVSSKIFQSDNAASYPRRNGVSAGSSLKPSFRHLSRWAIISVVDLKLLSLVGLGRLLVDGNAANSPVLFVGDLSINLVSRTVLLNENQVTQTGCVGTAGSCARRRGAVVREWVLPDGPRSRGCRRGRCEHLTLGIGGICFEIVFHPLDSCSERKLSISSIETGESTT